MGPLSSGGALTLTTSGDPPYEARKLTCTAD